MAVTDRRGSILGKVLIFVFGAGLIFSIFYPKMLWDRVENNQQESRNRMLNLWTAQTFYKSSFKSYTDTLEVLVVKLKTDSVFQVYKDSLMTMTLDSVITDPINGMPYTVTLQDSAPIIKIESPVVPCTTKALGIFPVEIENPGYIEDGKPSWGM
jgi:hypothetical protein